MQQLTESAEFQNVPHKSIMVKDENNNADTELVPPRDCTTSSMQFLHSALVIGRTVLLGLFVSWLNCIAFNHLLKERHKSRWKNFWLQEDYQFHLKCTYGDAQKSNSPPMLHYQNQLPPTCTPRWQKRERKKRLHVVNILWGTFTGKIYFTGGPFVGFPWH